MAAKTVSTQLVVDKVCKNSIRFSTKNKDTEKVLLTIYVLNSALKQLGNPEEIDVEIKTLSKNTKK